jgi:hypothetical protein
MSKTLDEILDGYLEDRTKFASLGEENIREITRLNVGSLVLDIYAEALKSGGSFTEMSDIFRSELKKRLGIKDDSIE